LIGNRFFQSVLIRLLINFEQEFALFYELIIAHMQPDDPAFDLRRNSNEVREHFGVVGPWIVIRSVKDH